MVLLAMCAGAYFVLVHAPNAVEADNTELLFGDDLYLDVIAPTDPQHQAAHVRDAFTQQVDRRPAPTDPLIAPNEQINITPQAADAGTLVLQSIVSSHEGRFAVINGRLIREGSAIEGATLMNIADNWVLMQRDGEQFTVRGRLDDRAARPQANAGAARVLEACAVAAQQVEVRRVLVV